MKSSVGRFSWRRTLRGSVAVIAAVATMLALSPTPARAASNQLCYPVFSVPEAGDNISACVTWYWYETGGKRRIEAIFGTYVASGFRSQSDNCTTGALLQMSAPGTTWDVPPVYDSCNLSMRYREVTYSTKIIDSGTTATDFRASLYVYLWWGDKYTRYGHTFRWVNKSEGCCLA